MVKMVTAIPKGLAQEFRKRGIVEHNTLPQLDSKFLDEIRQFMHENTGYEQYPVACLSRMHNNEVSIRGAVGGLADYIPVKAKESIIFELIAPEDTIVSIEYDAMLNANAAFSLATDKNDLSYVAEELHAVLKVGPVDAADTISFVPGLLLSRCKYFTILDSEFRAGEFEFPGVEQVNLQNLKSFR